MYECIILWKTESYNRQAERSSIGSEIPVRISAQKLEVLSLEQKMLAQNTSAADMSRRRSASTSMRCCVGVVPGA